ncbi:Endonuclease/exonuclease/phosphatase [Phlyctochytrium arcticum]|nr:Endonuclease/exonuclease/phosphatase [Phlyctochytrium arcticum]
MEMDTTTENHGGGGSGNGQKKPKKRNKAVTDPSNPNPASPLDLKIKRRQKLEKRAKQQKPSHVHTPIPDIPRAPPPPPRRLLPVPSCDAPVPRNAPFDPTKQPDDKATRRLTIMSYNILAQCLCRRELYQYCDKNDLKGKTRFPLIIEELTKTIRPDVACLQEVDCFSDVLEPALQDAGYDSEYLQKNSEKGTGHGLCIIWKRDLFRKHAYVPLHYDDSPLTHPTPKTPVTNNIAQMIALEFISSSADTQSPRTSRIPGLIITNTHLYWRPIAQYERLRQAYVLLQEAVKFRAQLETNSQEQSKDVLGWPLFLAGDWNSTPQTGMYRILTNQSMSDIQRSKLEPVEFEGPPLVPHEHDANTPEPANPASPPENPVPLPTLLSRLAALPKLESCYAAYRATDPSHTVNPSWLTIHGGTKQNPAATNKDEGGEFDNGGWGPDGEHWADEPTYTNFASWQGTLDYIFYTTANPTPSQVTEQSDTPSLPDPARPEIKVTHLLDIPHEEFLQPGLPSIHFPSDHVSLMAEIELSVPV